jgi:NADH:ubiquinone oxidoreductase subunit E
MGTDEMARKDIGYLRIKQEEDFNWLKKHIDSIANFLSIEYVKAEGYKKKTDTGTAVQAGEYYIRYNV